MSDNKPPHLSRQELGELWRRQKAREAEQLDQICQRVASSSAPLSSDLRGELTHLAYRHVREIMRHHEGYHLALRRNSYLSSLAILRDSIRTIVDKISCFEQEVLDEESNLLGPLGRERLMQIEIEIQKELFTCTNAALSLVDHARRFVKKLDIPEYNAKRLECFRDDGLHDFVASLRILLHHLQVVDASWSLTNNYQHGTKTASFIIQKDAFVQIIKENRSGLTTVQYNNANKFISAQPACIDIRKIFLEYQARCDCFNDWLVSVIASEKITALRDYDSIIKERNIYGQRLNYRALLKNWLHNWSKPPNPHDHLANYLTAKQLEAAYKLPRNSREQVDLVIAYADQEGIVDADIREDIYELFRRSEA